jgi:membrane-associated phospholipid phosphatase
MARGGRGEERLMWRWIGTGSRRGSSWPSRAGDVLRRPYVWAGCVAAITLSGPRGRRAALRGVLCAATSSTIHLLLKPLFRRRRPRGAQLMRLGPVTSSFPSGHTATDLGFTFGAAQEMPVLMVPLSVLTLGSHWSLIRGREHYPSDVLAGGALAFAVAATAWRLSPPQRAASGDRA